MPRGIMLVETRPKDPARVDEYHRWYDDVHLEEVVRAVGFLSGRRFGWVDGGDTFVAIFEFDDEIEAVRERVANARSTGRLSPSQAEVISARFLTELAAFGGHGS